MFFKLFVMIFLLSSCGEAEPKERQTKYRILGSSVTCDNLMVRGRGIYDLDDCSEGVKEIINATNIIMYE